MQCSITSSIRACLLSVAAALLFEIGFCGQPTYQVSLQIQLHPRSQPIYICSGIILQSRVILTSATCMFYEFSWESVWMPIPPSKISIVAGNSDAFNDAVSYAVSEINILEKFNSTTLENDLAIVRLSTSLPLNVRTDMSWIVLDDDEFKNNPCLANFFYRNSLDNIPDYTQMEEVPILMNSECTKSSKYRNRPKDLCSYYVLPLGFDCQQFNEFVEFNGDRGTGLVCNSRLVAVLSTILPLSGKNITSCSEMLVKAFYSNIGPHLDWIYDIIAYEEYMEISRGNYSSSIPYQQEASAIIEHSFTADTFNPTISKPSTTNKITTEVPTKMNAGASALRNCYKIFYAALISITFKVVFL